MKILLTGATGMVGKNILENPNRQSYSFLTPARTELDLINPANVKKYFEVHQPNVVIHCAGLVGGIQANMKEPVRFLTENLEMGKNVLLAAHEVGVEKFLNMGSSCMYPKDHQEALDENLILTGALEPTNEGYAIAKIAALKLAQFINVEKKSSNFKTLIPCNLYGRWDKFSESNSHLIPAVIKKIHHAIKSNQKNVEIWGSGNARREFMYAGDLADYVFFALKNWSDIPEVVNVGLGADHSINDYYQIVGEVMGYNGEFTHNLNQPEGMKRKLVSTKINDQLGWKAKVHLKDGIQKAYEFFLESENA